MKQFKGPPPPCPVCGLPRGKGKYEFAHGKCAETQAKTEKDELTTRKAVVFKGVTKMLKVESLKKAKDNSVRKKYLDGNKLPKWMTDK